jgi:hypothetical protein
MGAYTSYTTTLRLARNPGLGRHFLLLKIALATERSDG